MMPDRRRFRNRQLNARFLTIANHQIMPVEVLLLADFTFKLRCGFERGFTGLSFTPCQCFIVATQSAIIMPEE